MCFLQTGRISLKVRWKTIQSYGGSLIFPSEKWQQFTEINMMTLTTRCSLAIGVVVPALAPAFRECHHVWNFLLLVSQSVIITKITARRCKRPPIWTPPVYEPLSRRRFMERFRIQISSKPAYFVKVHHNKRELTDRGIPSTEIQDLDFRNGVPASSLAK